MTAQATIFLVSDRTGITVENLIRTLLTQFEEMPADVKVYPFLDTEEKLAEVIAEIDALAEINGAPPLVYSSVVDEALRSQIKKSRARVFDIFDIFLPPLVENLHLPSSAHIGRAHGINNVHEYDRRVEAVNFALSFDDGMRVKGLEQADIILLGVSRSGKTPTCLYLAMQYKVKAANFPLTEEDYMEGRLPEPLRPYKERLYGLSISAERLHQIREERRPNSEYASIAQCRREISAAEMLYRNERIPFRDSTSVSIEELAIKVMQAEGVKREF